MPTYYCKRIQSQVGAESSEHASGKVYVSCKHYTPGRNPCIRDFPNFKRCLVKIIVQKETKGKLVF